MSDLAERRAKLLAELAEVDSEQERLAGLDPEKRLAEQIHYLLCHLAHEDQCGWYWEKDWTGSAHQRYLRKAELALAASKGDADMVLAVIAATK